MKAKEPGIAMRVYFVQMLCKGEGGRVRGSGRERGKRKGRGSSLRDQSGFGEDGQERREVERRSPHPLTADPALREDETLVEDDGGDGVDDLRREREVSVGRRGERGTEKRTKEWMRALAIHCQKIRTLNCNAGKQTIVSTLERKRQKKP